MRTALYAGTFRPFTRGHQDIVDRTLALFDRVVVAVCCNIVKGSSAKDDTLERVEAIRALYADEPRMTVVSHSGLTVELARQVGATALVRGVRNGADLDAEKDLAEVNRRLSGIDTVLLPARPELECCSSSVVRELRAFGADDTPYLPLKH